jgi:glutathionylspermidine synthase
MKVKFEKRASNNSRKASNSKKIWQKLQKNHPKLLESWFKKNPDKHFAKTVRKILSR